MSDPKRARAEDGSAIPRPPQCVYVLVKTTDAEDAPREHLVSADTEVIGTYRTWELAEKAKLLEVSEGGYESYGDGETYHDGSSQHTSFKIFDQPILDASAFSDDDEDEETDGEEEEDEENEGGKEEEEEDEEEDEEDDDDEGAKDA